MVMTVPLTIAALLFLLHVGDRPAPGSWVSYHAITSSNEAADSTVSWWTVVLSVTAMGSHVSTVPGWA